MTPCRIRYKLSVVVTFLWKKSFLPYSTLNMAYNLSLPLSRSGFRLVNAAAVFDDSCTTSKSVKWNGVLIANNVPVLITFNIFRKPLINTNRECWNKWQKRMKNMSMVVNVVNIVKSVQETFFPAHILTLKMRHWVYYLIHCYVYNPLDLVWTQSFKYIDLFIAAFITNSEFYVYE